MIQVKQHKRRGYPVKSYSRTEPPAIRAMLAEQRAQTRARVVEETQPIQEHYQAILERRERRRRAVRIWCALPVRDKILTLWRKYREKRIS